MRKDKAKEFLKRVIENRNIKEQFEKLGFNKSYEEMTFEDALLCSQIAKAIKGDTKAFNAIVDHIDDDNDYDPLEEFLNENEMKNGKVVELYESKEKKH